MDNSIHSRCISNTSSLRKLIFEIKVASPSGVTTLPENSKQPGGDPIPWGVGHLAFSGRLTPSKPRVSPGSHLSARSCETLEQHQRTASLRDASTSNSDYDTLPPIRRYALSSGLDPVDFTQEARVASKGSRGGGPALGVQFFCVLATLLLLLL